MAKVGVVVLVIVLVVAALVVMGVGPFEIATTAALAPSRDTFIDSSQTGMNFGTLTTLRARISTASSLESLIAYDFTELGTVTSLTRATLSVQMTACSISGTVNIWFVGQLLAPTWTETGATWSNSGGQAEVVGEQATLMPFGTTTCPTLPATFTTDVTSIVQSWVISGAANNGFTMHVERVGGSDTIDFTMPSREGGTPTLYIEYTKSGEPPPPGVGEGTNETQPEQPPEEILPGLAAFFGGLPWLPIIGFILTFIVIVAISRRRPGLGAALGFGIGALVFIILLALTGGL